MNHIEQAMKRIRMAYELLDSDPSRKLYVAYSGGKDSECIVQLALDAIGPEGIDVHYHVSGIDPPEIVRHVRQKFRTWESLGVTCVFGKLPISMHDLIVRRGPPTRQIRYCCEYYKESHGVGRIVVTGVRWDESDRRRRIHGVVTQSSANKKHRRTYVDDNDISRKTLEACPTKAKIMINPIIDWDHHMVWDYIHTKGIAYCRLYDEGFHRLGCIGCPMAGTEGRYREFARWPHMRRYYLRSFKDMLEARPELTERLGWKTANDVFHWWMEDGVVLGQEEMDFDLEEGADAP